MIYQHQKLLLAAATFFFFAHPAANAAEMDDRIESAAKNSYVFKHYLKNDSVNVDANNGVVTLEGTVADSHRKSLAVNTVENLPGVTQVDNKLTVKDEPAADNSDGWLGLKVKTALLLHSKINPLMTHVDVKDGVVTLTGEVENQARKDLATEYAKDVGGVKDVKNDLVLKADTVEHKMNEVKDEAADKINAVKAEAREDVREAKEEAREAKAEAREAKADAMLDHNPYNNDDDEHIDDASITAQAKMALMFHRSTSSLSTKVETNDGVVTLTGKAKNQAERELATKIATDIRGVKNVVNNMEVVENK